MNIQRNSRRPVWMMLMVFTATVLIVSAASTARPSVVIETWHGRVPADGRTKNFTGQIVDVRSEKVTIVDAVGENHAFPVLDDTMIMLNGTEASLNGLNAGLLATVHAESQGGEWIAKSIHATQHY